MDTAPADMTPAEMNAFVKIFDREQGDAWENKAQPMTVVDCQACGKPTLIAAARKDDSIAVDCGRWECMKISGRAKEIRNG